MALRARLKGLISQRGARSSFTRSSPSLRIVVYSFVLWCRLVSTQRKGSSQRDSGTVGQ